MSETHEELLERIFARLTATINDPAVSPYDEDGSYAAAIQKLPLGLRAMAATHHLDLSLTLDDIGWHFLNFGDAAFVAETEAGLRVLSMNDLADWFHEAAEIVQPLKHDVAEDGSDFHQILETHGVLARIEELQKKAEALETNATGSAIYTAWAKYAQAHPDEVFPPE